MAINFPNSPTVGDRFSPAGGPTYVYAGSGIWQNIGQAAARRAIRVKTGAYTVTDADATALIVASGAASWTLALPAAAAVGSGFPFTLRNEGTGKVTIDPNGAETVNGLATIGVYPGDTVELVCDGTSWRALFASPFSTLQAGIIGTAVASLDLKLPPEFEGFDLQLRHFAPTVSASLGLRVSDDDGATFKTTGYGWFQHYASGAADSYYSYLAGSVWVGTGIELTSGAAAAQDGTVRNWDIDITPGRVSYAPGVRWQMQTSGYVAYGGGFYGSGGRFNAVRLLFNGTANIAVGSSFSLIGRRS